MKPLSEADTAGLPASSPRGNERPSTRRRRWLIISLVALVIALLLWGVSLATAGLAARRNLLAAQNQLREAQQAIARLEVEQAADPLRNATDALRAAVDRLGRPDVSLAASLPWVGGDLEAAKAVASAAKDVASAADDVVSAILDRGGLAAFAPRDGRIPTEDLAAIAPIAEQAAADIGEALATVHSAPEPRFIAQVGQARQDFLELVSPVEQSVEDLAGLLEALPRLLGHDEPTTYFLGAANPAELRGTGGFIGSYALATFDQGQLAIGPFTTIHDLPNLHPDEVDPPSEDFGSRYYPFGGAAVWKNLNMTPDFPTTGEAIENLWRTTSGDRLDGTILVDPYVLAALAQFTQPVSAPGAPEAIRSDDIVDYLTNGAYGNFESGEVRKEVLGDAAKGVVEQFLTTVDLDQLPRVLAELGDAVERRHLLLHAADPEIQEVLARIGADGSFSDPAGDLLAGFVNSAANSKVDYYLHRQLTYDVDLLADGAARGNLSVTFDNRAPTAGLVSHIIGPNVDRLDAGGNQFLYSVYCATACEFQAADGGAFEEASRSMELDHPVADSWVEIASGEEVALRYRWVSHDAWEEADGALQYRLAYRHQTAIQPTSVRVNVSVPDGFDVASVPDGAEVRGGVVTWSRTQRDDASWTVELVPSN